MGAPTACRRMVSGTVSLFCSKCFSPFPHGTCSLSVSREYLALPDGPGGFTQDSSCPALLRIPPRSTRLRVRSFHALRPRFPARSARRDSCVCAVLQPPRRRDAAGLGSSPVARHYWGNHVCFLFLRVLRCFSSPRWPPRQTARMSPLQDDGLSHSGTRGSQDTCSYPRIFAACRALHRLREPRHPPCALSCFLLSGAPTPWRRRACLLRLSSFLSQHVIDRASQPRDGVENNGFEPLTPCLQSRCSSQLS